jgi:integrase
VFEDKTYKRCACKGPLFDASGKPILLPDGTQKIGPLEKQCPQLSKTGHGSWYYSFELPSRPDGTRQKRAKKGGYATQRKAAADAAKLWKLAEQGINVVSDETVATFLARWIEAKKALKDTTSHGYQEHIDLYLVPHLGHLKVRDLRLHHIEAMFTAIEEETNKRVADRIQADSLGELERSAHAVWKAAHPRRRHAERMAWKQAEAEYAKAKAALKRPSYAATWHRIKSTLSSALKRAKIEGLVTENWAHLVELPSGKRPKALVWTPARIEQWKRTGKKPSPVMVWTPQQAGQFLDFAADDRLFPLWHGTMFRGFRRGESCAFEWDKHLDLDTGMVHVTEQIVTIAYEPQEDTPKADSVRDVQLDHESWRLHRELRARQDRERAEWSGEKAWVETGRVYTKENGEAYHPQHFTDRFDLLVEKAGLPPIRFHDLRHMAATLALAAGVDKKVVQEMLGHSSYHLTMDTYTSVLPELHQLAANAALSIVPRQSETNRGNDPALIMAQAGIPPEMIAQLIAQLTKGGADGGGQLPSAAADIQAEAVPADPADSEQQAEAA